MDELSSVADVFDTILEVESNCNDHEFSMSAYSTTKYLVSLQRAVKQTATARFEKTGFALANRDAHWKHDYRMEKRCFEQLVRDLSK